ncbi:MAG: hypothetical protein KGJ13_11475 [Patescibacteria group bacterium]|nr:hypothetical protein [Patescibacteria group bacterium]
MSYTYRINKAEKIHVTSTGQDLLSVEFSVLNGEDVVCTRAHGFDLDTDDTVIKDELQRAADNESAKAERAEAQSKVDAMHKKADETIGKLINA